jgi:type IV pilus assembly protein PilE
MLRPRCTARGRRRAGLSLIELVVALAIAALLGALSYPSLQAAVLKVRRGEALTTLTHWQLAQERHRSQHTRYATLAELGAASAPRSRYAYLEVDPSATGYRIIARAEGTQAADRACRFLAVTASGGDATRISGPDLALDNAEAENARCWSH